MLALCITWSCGPSPQPAKPPAPPLPVPLQTLVREHPRVIARERDFEVLRQRTASIEVLARWRRALLDEADGYIQDPLVPYEPPDGHSSHVTSNLVLDRTLALALAFRLTGDHRYSARLWRELDHAAHFADWNPAIFIDTADMTHAFAIGFDWLYAEWTPDQRRTLTEAIVTLGLQPGLDAYRSTGATGWWTRANHNWNQVCNGGMILGALAIADERPVLAAEIIDAARASAPRALAVYAPDGASLEGPSYWTYGTKYTVLAAAALESALGTDFGLTAAPGFLETGWYPIYMTGPSGRMFAFADTDPTRTAYSVPLWWLARKSGQRAYAQFARMVAKPLPYDLLFFTPESIEELSFESIGLDKYWRNLEVATFRGRWSDSNATFVGFKAGSNAVNHGHVDLGMFTLEAAGEQWIVELGTDDYSLPGYFGNERWSYYRVRAESHNLLLLGPDDRPGQDLAARAPITRFVSGKRASYAVADLSAAYKAQARQVHRGVALLDRRDVLVMDEIATQHPTEVWWFAHTRARIELDPSKRAATLFQNGKHIRATILGPANATFTAMPAVPLARSPAPPRQNANVDVQKLAIHLHDVSNERITVVFQIGDQTVDASVMPDRLDRW